MAKVNVRKETGKLYFDFRYKGVRCRETTALDETPANRKMAETVLKKIEAAITLGQFNYADFFPNSQMVARFEDRSQRLETHHASLDGVPTVVEFKKVWFGEMTPTWRYSYIKSVTNLYGTHIIPEFGDKVISHITKADILAFRAKLAKASPETGKTRAPSTVNKILKVFRLMMSEAADRFDFTSPFTNVALLKEPKTDIQPFTLDEVSLILKHVRPDFRDYFKLRFYSGMRSGEVAGLRWQYVDFERNQLLVRETIIDGRVEYTKNDGSQREIDMTTPVMEALRAQQKVTGKGDYVFCNREGEPLDNHNVCNRVWYPLLRRLDLRKRRMYETRHTAATFWMAAGENPEWIARQMGHVNTEMLFKVYSRFVPNLTRQDGSAFEQMLSAQPQRNEGGES
ncbi:MAG: site-specific integrase [Pseudomonadota bacterium]